MLKTIVEIATETIGTETGLLMLINEEKNVLEIHEQRGYPEGKLPAQIPLDAGIVAKVIENKSSVITSDFTSSHQYAGYRRFGFETESCLLTPILLKEKVIGLVFLGNKLNHDFFTAGNEKLLTALCNQAAIFIENVRLFEESLAQHRLQQQLKIAHDIQTSLLPSQPPEIPGFDLYGISVPAVDVGGDYFDYIELRDERWGVVVGDVAGKGVPAALLMTTTRSMLRSQAYLEKTSSRMLTKLNDQLVKEDIPDRFVTMIYAILEPDSREIRFSCAGHDPLLVYHGSENKFREYHPKGLVLGIMPDQQYEELKINPGDGDIALIYTDGITEALNDRNEEFGLQGLKDIVEKHHELSAHEIADEVLKAVRRFSHDCSQHDDITLMVIKRL